LTYVPRDSDCVGEANGKADKNNSSPNRGSLIPALSRSPNLESSPLLGAAILRIKTPRHLESKWEGPRYRTCKASDRTSAPHFCSPHITRLSFSRTRVLWGPLPRAYGSRRMGMSWSPWPYPSSGRGVRTFLESLRTYLTSAKPCCSSGFNSHPGCCRRAPSTPLTSHKSTRTLC
jgi:hypothetical protein